MAGHTLWLWLLAGAAAEAGAEEALRPQLQASGEDNPADDVLTPGDWQRDDWTLVRPKVALLEIGGYLRLHAETLRRMGLGRGQGTEVDPDGRPRQRYPGFGGSPDFSSTRMRLRLEPRINIGERARIESTWDLLDNLVLGSTPDSYYLRPDGRQQADVLSLSQVPPRRGVDSFSDAIVVKRLWGRLTAFNEQVELKVGRMPDHFGLGVVFNDGNGLEANWGTVVDRLALSFRAFEHVITPMVDWVGRGPLWLPFGAGDPMPLNATGRDDTMQYALRIQRRDHPDDVQDALAHGRTAVSYGTHHAFRLQPASYITADLSPAAGNPPAPPVPTVDAVRQRRDAFLYLGDLWGSWQRGTWSLAAELALQAGHFTDALTGDNITESRTRVLKAGGAAEGRWRRRLDGQGLQLGLMTGAASGDAHRGMGALDAADTQRGGDDRSLTNFAFHPDYHVDQLMFRRLIGQVTDAWYLRPEVGYRFDRQWLGRVSAVYAQLLRPSSQAAGDGEVGPRPLGVEVDAELRLGPERPGPDGAVMASVVGGVLFPLGALDPTTLDRQGSRFAWTAQARMWLTF